MTGRARPCRVATIALLVGLFSAAAARAQTVVDTCGQVVSGPGVLTADLDCTGFAADAVNLEPGASLDLAGFTLVGGDADAVVCGGSCRVFSSSITKGTIRDAGRDGIKTLEGVDSEHTITVANLVISGNGDDGVIGGFCCFAGNAVVMDSEIVDNGGVGAGAVKRISVQRSTVSRNDVGVSGCIVAIVESVADDNVAYGVGSCGVGFRARVTRANGNGYYGFLVGRDQGGVAFKDCEASGNTLDGIFFDRLDSIGPKIIGGTFNANGRDGIRFDDERFMGNVRAKVIRTEASGNGANGIFIGPDRPIDQIKLRRITLNGNGAAGISGSFTGRGVDVGASTISANGTGGVEALPPTSSTGPCPVRVGSSIVTGNAAGPECGVTITCADVAACEAPSISSSAECGTSYDTSSGFPGSNWAVCSAD